MDRVFWADEWQEISLHANTGKVNHDAIYGYQNESGNLFFDAPVIAGDWNLICDSFPWAPMRLQQSLVYLCKSYQATLPYKTAFTNLSNFMKCGLAGSILGVEVHTF